MDFPCQKCGKTLRVPDNVDGRTIRCPNCGFLFTLSGGMVSPIVPPCAPDSCAPDSPDSCAPDYSSQSIPVSEFQQTQTAGPSSSLKPVRLVPNAASFVQQRPLYPTRVNLCAVISDSWRLFSDNLGSIIGAFCLYFMIYTIFWAPLFVFEVLQKMAMENSGMRESPDIIYICTNIYNIMFSLFAIWLTTGLFRYLVTIARGETAQYSLLFSGGNALWRYFLLSICWTLIFIAVAFAFFLVYGGACLVFAACCAPDMSRETVCLLLIGGVMLYLILTMPIVLRVFLSYVLVMDTGIRLWESIRVSWIAMRGNCLALLGAWFFGFFVIVFGMICFCIGAIFAIPYIHLLMAVFYLHATGQAKSIPELEGKEYL